MLVGITSGGEGRGCNGDKGLTDALEDHVDCHGQVDEFSRLEEFKCRATVTEVR